MNSQGRRVQLTDGRFLNVVEDGDLEGWPIFVHHGTPASARLYAPHVQYARERGIRLVGYDRPGYGGSDPHPGRKVADAAEDVRGIADALGIPRFAVWGHSGGGNHALACAALLPERVSAVAASAAVAPYGVEGLDWLEGMVSGNLDEFHATLAGRDELERYLRPQWLASQKANKEIPPELASLLSPEDLSLLGGELGNYLEAATNEGLKSGLAGWIDDDLECVTPWGFDPGSVRVPTSIWHGKRDLFVPWSHSIWLSKHIPGSELRLFDDETHLTFFDRRVFELFDWLLARSGVPPRHRL